MDKIFLTILNMSLTGAVVILVIYLARLGLKKAPKIVSYCLWALAGFRLLFPFSIESVISLMPFKFAPIPTDIAMQATPRIDSGVEIVDSTINTILFAPPPNVTASINPLQFWTSIGAYLWLLGVMVMLVYGLVSFLLLK